MKKTQINKLSNQIYELEKIYSSENSTEKEKEKAELEMLRLLSYIMLLPDGFDVFAQIDDIIMKKLEK